MVKAATIKKRKGRRPFHPLAGRSSETHHGCYNGCHTYTPHTRYLCQFGYCTEFYCDWCGRYSWGAGPVGCRCDWNRKGCGGYGHRTKDEQPRRSVPVKERNVRLLWRLMCWRYGHVVPSGKERCVFCRARVRRQLCQGF